MNSMRTGRHFALIAVACALLLLPALAEEKEPLGDLVDLNSATAAALTKLPGVGEVIARRIIRHREISGPFRSVNELLVIRGISRKKLEVLRPLVTVKGEKKQGEGKAGE
jgi:competence ComEA-like helix-hairpin-helix protein